MQYLQKTTSDINIFPNTPCVVGEFISSSSRITKYCPYTSGLVFWLDGIDKGPNSGDWTDLINGYRFVNNGNVNGDDTGWLFDSSTNAGQNGTQYFIYSAGLNNLMANTCTIEVVYKCDKDARWCIFNQDANNKIMFGVDSYGTKCYTYNGVNGASYTRTAGLEPAVTMSANATLCYRNGSVVSRTDSGKYTISGGGAIVGCYKTAASDNWPFYGKIYSIRIYNRKLNAAEMIYNQRIDNGRFNLGLEI